MWKFITEVAVKISHSGKDFLRATVNDINILYVKVLERRQHVTLLGEELKSSSAVGIWRKGKRHVVSTLNINLLVPWQVSF
jgi:hypothetical protein